MLPSLRSVPSGPPGLLLFVLFFLFDVAKAQYLKADGSPAESPCVVGQTYYFGPQMTFICKSGNQFELSGCKVGNVLYSAGQTVTNGNLRKVMCKKEGNSIVSRVEGCVTDDGVFLDDTKTVTQKDGTTFTCTKIPNGFKYTKTTRPPPVVDCQPGETTIQADRFYFSCEKNSQGDQHFVFRGCCAERGKNTTIVKINETFDELTDSGSQKNGFRYQCLLEGNRQIYHPIGCLFSGKFYAPGGIIKEGSYSLICREEAGIIRIEPYYYTPTPTEGSCSSDRTYIEGSFQLRCVKGRNPKPIACAFMGSEKNLVKPGTFYDDKYAYRYTCEWNQAKTLLRFYAIACLDSNNRVLAENDTAVMSVGSRILCRRGSVQLERVVISSGLSGEWETGWQTGGGASGSGDGSCKAGQRIVKRYVVYECRGGKYVNVECAPFGNLSKIVKAGAFYDENGYRFKCCDHTDQPGMMVYEAVERGCKHPTLPKIIRPLDVFDVEHQAGDIKYYVRYKCTLQPGSGQYALVPYGCTISGLTVKLGAFGQLKERAVKCVMDMPGIIRIIIVEITTLSCRVGGKVYKHGEVWHSKEAYTTYACEFGVIRKKSCEVHGKVIPLVDDERNSILS